MALAEGAGCKPVAAALFGTVCGGDEAACEVGVVGDVDLKPFVTGEDAALFGDGGMVGADFGLAVAA